MGTTVDDISGWFDTGRRMGATHLVIMTDTFSYEDYPVYVMLGTDVTELVHGRKNVPGKEDIVGKAGQNMQSLREVYALHLSKDMQMSERRSLHYEYPAVSGGSKEGTEEVREQGGGRQSPTGGAPR